MFLMTFNKRILTPWSLTKFLNVRFFKTRASSRSRWRLKYHPSIVYLFDLAVLRLLVLFEYVCIKLNSYFRVWIFLASIDKIFSLRFLWILCMLSLYANLCICQHAWSILSLELLLQCIFNVFTLWVFIFILLTPKHFSSFYLQHVQYCISIFFLSFIPFRAFLLIQ